MVVLDQNSDTLTSTGKLLFKMLASIAELETEIRKDRQMEDIAKAKEKGVRFGRKSKLSDNQMKKYAKLTRGHADGYFTHRCSPLQSVFLHFLA